MIFNESVQTPPWVSDETVGPNNVNDSKSNLNQQTSKKENVFDETIAVFCRKNENEWKNSLNCNFKSDLMAVAL